MTAWQIALKQLLSRPMDLEERASLHGPSNEDRRAWQRECYRRRKEEAAANRERMAA